MNIIYTAKIGYKDSLANFTENRLKEYANNHNVDFKCIEKNNEIEYISEQTSSKAGVYSSIYAIYDFLESPYERMIWTDIDVIFFTKQNLFDTLPNLYLENGFPKGKIYNSDCRFKLEKLKLVNLFLNNNYTITVQTGLFSIDKYYARKFIECIEKYCDFNSHKSICNFCDILVKNSFIPNEEPFFEIFVIENNITPFRLVKTNYTEKLKNNNFDCDIAHFCTNEGRKLLNRIKNEL